MYIKYDQQPNGRISAARKGASGRRTGPSRTGATVIESSIPTDDGCLARRLNLVVHFKPYGLRPGCCFCPRVLARVLLTGSDTSGSKVAAVRLKA